MAGPTATTPVLWLKADSGVYSDAGSTLANNNDTVQQWNDQSGNGNNATQGTSANRPTFKTSQQNGLAAVEFSGSPVRLDNAYTSDPKTIIVIGKNTGTGHRGWAGADTSDAVSVGSYYFKASNSGNQAEYLRAYASGESVLSATANDSTPSSEWMIQSARLSGTSTAETWINGALVATATTATALRPVSGTPVIGAAYYANSVVDFLTGQIGELLMYDTALSDAELREVEEYLVARWNAPPVPSTDYIATFFSSEVIQPHSSTNASTFTALRKLLDLDLGAVRDPSPLYRRANEYYCAFTTGSFGVIGKFSIAKSYNFSDWFPWCDVDTSSVVGNDADSRTWAPEWFVDGNGDVYIIFSGSTNGASTFGFYEVHPTNDAWTTWSSPVQITGSALNNTDIDAFIVLLNGTYYLWRRNGTSNEIDCVSSSSLLSGYNTLESFDPGFGSGFEGPSVLLLNDDTTWRIYGDDYVNLDSIDYASSTDDFATWSSPANISPTGKRHGTVRRNEYYILPPTRPWYYYAQQ
jgi:hypothetical protein